MTIYRAFGFMFAIKSDDGKVMGFFASLADAERMVKSLLDGMKRREEPNA